MAKAFLPILLALVMAGACYGGDQPLGQLPELGRPIVVDGDLGEWAGAVSVPVWSRYDICFAASGYQWRGPADVSMEAYCAWSREGLCLATVVADDVVENLRTDDAIYLEDSIELYVDGRRPEVQATSPYSAGAYQIMITPPLPDHPAQARINDRDGEIPDLRVAGNRTPTGYVIETLIPWRAFPEFTPKPGAQIAFNFAVNDYDGPDPKAERPVQLNRDGAQLMWEHPEGCLKWTLVEARREEVTPSGPFVSFDVPSVIAAGVPPQLTAAVGTLLSGRAGSARFTATDWAGRSLLDRTVAVSPAPPPWSSAVQATLDWPSELTPPGGVMAVSVVVNDRAGRPLGAATRRVLVQRAQREALARLKAADVAKLARTNPLKAAQYLGAAACYEKLKRAAVTQDGPLAMRSARELNARLDVLEGRRVPADETGLLDLLNLAAVPEAQVVVEYPMVLGESGETDCGLVTCYWGAVPLAGATVLRYATAAEAAKQLTSISWFGVLVQPAERTSLDGLPAMLARRLGRRTFDLAGFSPETQVAMVWKGSGFLRVIAIGLLPSVGAEAAAMLPDCPPPVRDAVTAWAKRTGRPVVSLEKAMARDTFLLAGDVRHVAARLGTTYAFSYLVQPEAADLWVQQGDRVILVSAGSRALCERVARLVLAGRAISLAEVEALRQELVRQFAPALSAPALPEGFEFYCGDVHMHSFYSDGTPTPAGLWLGALYGYMDFVVITDHDTLEGARLAQRLGGEHGFPYRAIVGEESNADDYSDVGAFPLARPIPASVSMGELVKAAHAQGAVIQWNHPGSPFSPWAYEHLAQGIGDTALDAWEHLPNEYDAWKQAGTLPVVVGATDTHDGTFGGASHQERVVERTMILARDPHERDVAEAIRTRHAVAVIPNGRLFYGDDDMVTQAWSALAEGKALKASTVSRLHMNLAYADLVGLLEASPGGK